MPRRPTARLAWIAACLWAAPAGAGDTITGVCPDGSIFIVQSSAAIPCRDARQVEPQEVPPLKPEMLPRPYAWEVFRQQQDPNNPYNQVEAARRVREAGRAGEAVESREAAIDPEPSPPPSAPPEPERTALLREPTRPPLAPQPRFSDQEIRDLLLIVELTQQRSPATFEPEEDRAVLVRLAHSAAFGAHLRELRARHGQPLRGPVLLFSAVAHEQSRFHAHLTFVQGHQAYQPDASDPGQLGVIHGTLGVVTPDQAVLGYVVLPENLDPAQPMDIYWNDRRLTATLRPAQPDLRAR